MAARRPDLAFQDDAALLNGDPVQRNALLAAMARGGAKYVRANVMYGATQGGRDLSKVNALVAAARAHGLKVQETLMPTPQYADQSFGGLTYNHPNSRLMGQFAQRVAAAQHGQVGRFSIGNEPNLETFLKAKDPALAYRRMYQAGYKAIKGVSKGNQVLFGEIVGAHQGLKFLSDVVNRGSHALRTSGVAWHPYDSVNGVEYGRGDKDSATITSLGRLTSALQADRSRLRGSTGGAAPMYLTELGYAPSTPGLAARQVKAQRLAASAGARENLWYQVAPPPAASVAPATDIYGNLTGGVAGPSAGGSWNTQFAPVTALEQRARMLLRATPRSRGR